ncbi:heterokaryon incompatibility protein-domain-containing protein, partial [Xylariales sp. AK1849]
MRLLDVRTMQLKEFLGRDLPRYAILSHTWGEEEVTFNDLSQIEQASWKKGFSKMEQVACVAKKQGLDYFWVDTCCIDKSSSAELSEAINSMFAWYRDAAVCYAYLSDLHVGSSLDDISLSTSLASCRWFTRGWTLQELLAPSKLEFYDSCWNCLGGRDTAAILRSISEITSIDEDILRDNRRMRQVSVGRKMSWAAKRTTTRVEDMAYCLLGIFDINMPLLYGEGRKAFLRLQEEIIRGTTDTSILAW